ncbi:MAG: tetratricopeptide repeat protein [Thalassobaculum sp.]|uniref:hypothetical protein n=1 Tax=Thalassobaculum sp. TaxID=2022740 RepID=UPI0032EC70AA
MATFIQRIIAGEPAAVERAEAYIRESPAGEHVPDLRKALIQHYTRAPGVRRDAGVNHLDRDREAALRHRRALHAAFPQDTWQTFQLGNLLTDTGRCDEAMTVLEALRAASPDGPLEINVLTAIARVHRIRGEFDRAAAVLERTLSQAREVFGADPKDEQAQFVGAVLARLARIFVLTGDPARAARVIEDFPQANRHPLLRRTLLRARALLRDGPPSQHRDARPVDLNALTVACVKHGTKYGPDYVNRLYAMVRRHLPGDWRFVCHTDDPSGLRPEVGVIDISRTGLRGWWTKLALFDPATPIADRTVLYLDLDTVVVGDLRFIGELKVGFHIMEHPDAPGFNSSVMLFDRAFAAPLHRDFRQQDMDRLPGDQDWIEECMPGIDTFPHGLAHVYRGLHPDLDSPGLARTGIRIVTFPTEPKPHQIRHGWVPEHWR